MLPSISGESAFPKLYRDMRLAIAACQRVEELKEMTNKAEALAAYFKAANDDESIRKVHDIKLRAWRRIGELLLSNPAVAAEEHTTMAYRAACSRYDLRAMRPHEVKLAIRIARCPAEDFNAFVADAEGRLKKLLDLADPDKRFSLARKEAEQKDQQAWGAALRKSSVCCIVVGGEAVPITILRPTPEEEAIADSLNESDEKEHDVGLTLQRTFRRPMRVFGFYISFEAHEQLRRAAFDRRRTMHHVMREALDMWFAANGLPKIAAIPDTEERAA